MTAKITSKGQITIPKRIRDRLGLRPGDHVDVAEDGRGARLKKIQSEDPFDKWRGYLKNLGGRTTDELMEEMRGRPR